MGFHGTNPSILLIYIPLVLLLNTFIEAVHPINQLLKISFPYSFHHKTAVKCKTYERTEHLFFFILSNPLVTV